MMTRQMGADINQVHQKKQKNGCLASVLKLVENKDKPLDFSRVGVKSCN